MKKIALSLILMAASLSAQAFTCTQNEAQFFGRVADVQFHGGDFCTYRIELTQFTPSGVCPLNEEDAALSRYEAVSCADVQEGQEISGYLVQKLGKVVVE